MTASAVGGGLSRILQGGDVRGQRQRQSRTPRIECLDLRRVRSRGSHWALSAGSRCRHEVAKTRCRRTRPEHDLVLDRRVFFTRQRFPLSAPRRGFRAVHRDPELDPICQLCVGAMALTSMGPWFAGGTRPPVCPPSRPDQPAAGAC
jgi:hypothetical protein